MKKLFRLLSVIFVFAMMLAACGGGGGGDAPPPATTTATYAVTYDGNGHTSGTAPAAANYAQDQVVTVPGNPGNLCKTHLNFNGWNTKSDGSGTNYAQGQTFKMGISAVALYACWVPDPSYTVTYNGNGSTGGTVPTDTTHYVNGDTITVIGNTGNLVKNSYYFTEWNTASDGTGTTYAPGATFKMGSANVTLYAVWTQKPYTVTYHGNSNTSGTVPVDTVHYQTGDTVQALGNTGNLARTHYTWKGWNTKADGSGTDYNAGNNFLMGSSNVDLYATWTQNPTYTVTYYGNDNTGGIVPVDTNNYYQGDTVQALGNTGNLARTHYTWKGWNTKADGSGTDYNAGNNFLMGSSNVDLYATWTQNPTYTVTYYGNDNTGGSPPTDTNNYYQGDTVIVLGNTGNLAKTNYTFNNWNTASDGSGTTYAQGATFTMQTSNVILYAKWTADSPGDMITFNADGVDFKMAYAPGKTFPTLNDDSVNQTVTDAYWIGETEVTYELWKKVLDWAKLNGYTFANDGAMGGSNVAFTPTNKHPVTYVSWRDVIVWTNALSELMGRTPVYTYTGVTIKDSTNADACNNAVAGSTKGFRLPTNYEWELAARWRNDDTNTVGGFANPYFTKGNSASDATAGVSDATATGEVAWYNNQATGSTHEVGGKRANDLALFDMSGNVWEATFDKTIRGGSWGSVPDPWMPLGYIVSIAADTSGNNQYTGFRLARTE